ncbi:MAG TPA: universal stress protein [Planctomycetota bacterium]
MFKKILVPLDGSENAERALPWVKRYAAREKALAVLTRVIPRDPVDDGPPVEVERLEAQDYLLRMERDLNYAGVPTKMVVREGAAPAALVREADDEGCDLIVMTTRGKTKIGRWRVGGVTAQVTRLSHIPVLVVRSRTSLARQGHVRKIVVPLDGSATAEAILPWAEALARRHKASLLFLHVAARDDARVEALRRRSGRLTQALRTRGTRAVVRVTHGDPAEEILRAAGPDDLIAMTTHGYGGFKRWIFGSVAERVCLAASVPVFVYRGPSPAAKHRTLEGALA